MKKTELNLTAPELEKLILLMEDKYSKTGMFYPTKILFDKLINAQKTTTKTRVYILKEHVNGKKLWCIYEEDTLELICAESTKKEALLVAKENDFKIAN